MNLNMALPLSTRLANRKAGQKYKNEVYGGCAGKLNKSDKCAWYSSLKDVKADYRFVQHAHKIVRLGHNGWYADNFQSGLICGFVVRLPGKAGKPRYLAGIEATEWDSTAVLAESYDDECDAARAADGHAERYAEVSREDDLEQLVEQAIEDRGEEITTLNTEIAELTAEVEPLSTCGYFRAAAALEELIADKQAEVSKLEKSIKKITDEPWTLVA